MKVPPRDVDRFLKQPPAELRGALFFGPDEGLVRERARRLAASVIDDLDDPFRVVAFSGAEIGADPARLADEANALSMTGGRRLLQLRGSGDGLANPLKALLDGPICEALIIIEAGALPPRSGLRRLLEQSRAGAAIGCYPDEGRDLIGLIEDDLRGHGLRAERDVIAYLAISLGGDRMITRSELEKLALYCAEAGAVTLEDAVALVGDSASLGLDDIALATADGDHAAVDRAVARLLRENVASIAILRAVGRHFMRLQLAAGLVEAGKSPRDAIGALRPPVFFKHAPRLTAQLRWWPRHSLAAALDHLLDAELRCKTTGAPDAAIVSRTLLLIANAAVRSRRLAA
ncbi:MAG TPA: DNA polymerase III subunit delta [Alphaproteobacteria bacterium]|nr:DNA polymerase III subunit delta [Alphaproteobacteria bacterium]